MDAETYAILYELHKAINLAIDKLIVKRNNAFLREKYFYRYTSRKLEQALGCVGKALDKIEGKDG
jgi:hypothetical protein